MRNKQTKKAALLRRPDDTNFQEMALTQMAYLEAGLVPPATANTWRAPHVQSAGELSPCNFPRGAKRKFRKEWRRALAALQSRGLVSERDAKKWSATSIGKNGIAPSGSARQRRRALVQDTMVRRGQEILTRCEQAPVDGVQSSLDTESHEEAS
ncbi:MAG: hypothetical protein EBT03_07425 [Betaproteobacteria bacterium]|nr:hypothetical protein [Betaproteobacteria bacterium]NCA17002.1 hypothetical protein [Betaproteobacteria bacterium]